MPSGAVKEGRSQAAQFSDWIKQFGDMANLFTGPAGEQLLQFLSGAGFENFNSLLGALRGAPGQINSQYATRSGAAQFPPELQQLIQTLQGLSGVAGANLVSTSGATPDSMYTGDRLRDMLTYGDPQIRDTATGIINRGGYSQGSAELFDIARQLMNFGGMTAPLMDSQKVGLEIVGQRGRTAESERGLNEFLNVISAGGRDSGTSALFSQGQQIAANGGWTPQMQGLLNQINGLMSQGGMTPEARQVFDKAMGLVNANGEGGALLPQDQMITMAREAANTAMLQKAESAYRTMARLTGGAVGAGTAGSALASFSNEAAIAESDAIRNAILARQDQQMKQFLASMGIAGDVTKTASGLLGQLGLAGGDLSRAASSNLATGAGLMSDSERIAADRLRTATGGFSDTLAQEINRLNSGANLVFGAQQQANARMGMGMETAGRMETLANAQTINALQSLVADNQMSLGAGDALVRLFGAQTGRELGGFDAIAKLGGLTSSTSLGQQGIDIQALDNQIRAMLSAAGLESTVANNLAGTFMQGISGLTNLGSLYTGMMPSLFSGYGNVSNALIQAAMQPGFWSRLANTAVGGVAGGLTGGLGGLVSGLGSGRTSGGINSSVWDVPGGNG